MTIGLLVAMAATLNASNPGYSIDALGDGNGLTIASEGGAMTDANLALTTAGAVAFGSSELGGSHLIANANDGMYGNSHSWLNVNGRSYVTGEFIGIVLAEETTIGSIAFGRDNAAEPDALYPFEGEWLTDRCLDTYLLQYTDSDITDINNAVWTDIGSLTYSIDLSAGTGYAAYDGSEFYTARKRHVIEFDPVDATAIRIIISNSRTCIDEFEVYTAVPEPSTIMLLLGVFASLVVLRRVKKS